MNKYAILGAGGSFGVHTAKYLLGQGHEVIGIGRAPLRPAAFTFGIEREPGFRYFTFHVGQETDLLLEMLDQEQPDVIVNYAAQGEGAISWKHSWRFFETNCVSLVDLVEALGSCSWLSHFVQIGTSEVYGSRQHAANEVDPVWPSSPYAASKLAFDHHLLSVQRVLGFPASIIRPSNCYCPGQQLHRVVPKAVVAGLTGRKLPLQGGGKAEKSYLHATDLARAIHLVGEGDRRGEIYNVGPARSISIEYLMRATAGALGLEFEDLCEVAEARPGEDAKYWLSSSKIQRDFGWHPEISLDHGLQQMVAWGRENLDVLRDWPVTYTLRA